MLCNICNPNQKTMIFPEILPDSIPLIKEIPCSDCGKIIQVPLEQD